MERLGGVGELSKDLEAELPYWILVLEAKISPKELDTYSMEDIFVLNGILEMRKDYERAQQGYELMKRDKNKR